MSKQVVEALFSNPLVQDDFFDDFQGLDATKWTDLSAGAGASADLATDGESAVILTTGAVAEQDVILHTVRTWDIVNNRPIRIEVDLNYAEAATDDANILMGLHDAPIADEMQDAGAGPPASYSGVNFHKVDGGTAWIVESSVAGTQVTNTVKDYTPGGSVWQRFLIAIRPISSTEAKITYGIGAGLGSHFDACRDATTGQVISHAMTYTSFAAADLCLMAKAGAAGTGETPRFGYVRCSQVR